MVHKLTVTIAATGTPQQISATRELADWILFYNGGANPMAVGDSTVAIADDTPLDIGEMEQWPSIGDGPPYNLHTIYVVGTQNDVLRVKYFTK